MTGTTDTDLIRSAFDAFNADDVDALLSRMAPDFVINLAGAPQQRGLDVWRRGYDAMRHGFPDIRAEIDDVVAAGGRVALRLTFRGTHTGTFHGIPPTGRAVEYTSHEFYRVADGVIAEEWICSDLATLLRQLG
ncbi:ester cyclase [Marinitenerispora sediminis]|uniref:Ester cyclase n=1 Tax=Marinitenerispora sediminis TaxID=1931232 RepID=A0A368T0I4_9ACTN|nr:ester cyclase [Marinitenerispora sediminis]RCV48363.1 ester cyclase [Marinitenerispora sediminis]RCV49757.1 ester cyclase [Marinitenerispora sediminis]RCV52558.1 ester cyclase [Marinitenerispora sediminis]